MNWGDEYYRLLDDHATDGIVDIGVDRHLIFDRSASGWSIAEAIETPIDVTKRSKDGLVA